MWLIQIPSHAPFQQLEPRIVAVSVGEELRHLSLKQQAVFNYTFAGFPPCTRLPVLRSCSVNAALFTFTFAM
jgi:hypothetical protein